MPTCHGTFRFFLAKLHNFLHIFSDIHCRRNQSNKMDGERPLLILKLRAENDTVAVVKLSAHSFTQWLHITLPIISKETILGGEIQELQYGSLWSFLGVESRKWQEVTSKRNEYCCNPNVHWMPHKEHPSLHSWQRATREIPKSTMFLPPKNTPVFYSFGHALKGGGVVLLKRPPKDPPFPNLFSCGQK